MVIAEILSSSPHVSPCLVKPKVLHSCMLFVVASEETRFSCPKEKGNSLPQVHLHSEMTTPNRCVSL